MQMLESPHFSNCAPPQAQPPEFRGKGREQWFASDGRDQAQDGPGRKPTFFCTY